MKITLSPKTITLSPDQMKFVSNFERLHIAQDQKLIYSKPRKCGPSFDLSDIWIDESSQPVFFPAGYKNRAARRMKK